MIQQTSDPTQIQNILSRAINPSIKPLHPASSSAIMSTATHPHYVPASTLTPALPGTGRGSQQGKYKDIVLMDEYGEEIPMKRKNRTSTDDASPDQKRQRFLERNR